MANKIYVGKISSDKLEVFRSEIKPPVLTHSQYVYIIGHFRTVRGANFCAEHPYSHCSTVGDFERAALRHEGQSQLIEAYKRHL